MLLKRTMRRKARNEPKRLKVDVEHFGNERMADRPDGLDLVLEPAEAFGIIGKLDRNSLENANLSVSRDEEHFALSATAQRPDNSPRTDHLNRFGLGRRRTRDAGNRSH